MAVVMMSPLPGGVSMMMISSGLAVRCCRVDLLAGSTGNPKGSASLSVRSAHAEAEPWGSASLTLTVRPDSWRGTGKEDGGRGLTDATLGVDDAPDHGDIFQ